MPGLRENLYKLRETRRMLYDRESRPYFGDLAEQSAEAQPEVPVLGPPDNRGLLRQLFVVGTFAIGPNVLNDGAVIMSEDDHGRGVRLLVVRPAGLHRDPARPGADADRRAPGTQHARWPAAAR